MPITFRPTRLADGRELIYVDDADTTLPPGGERSVDARTLDPRPATATMRQDPLTGEWISIASNRQNRVFLPPADQDPLAPQTAANPSEVPALYDVAVFENRSPSFGPALEDADAPRDLADLAEIGLERSRTSVGRCEVVCFSPEHEGSFGSLSVSRARMVSSPELEKRASSWRSRVKLFTAATDDRISKARSINVDSSAFTRSARSSIMRE